MMQPPRKSAGGCVFGNHGQKTDQQTWDMSIMFRSCIAISCLMLCLSASAQFAEQHRLTYDNATPGSLGGMRQDLRGPVQCRYQPVKVTTASKARISFAQGQMFQQGSNDPVYAGLVLGSVYRLRITDIPLYEGYEVFPTIELMDRIYPPPGQEVRFAIPIVISEDDLVAAINGQLVTRVIYLEDPQTALPLADEPGTQQELNIQASQDAIEVADSLGRPVAIVRFGSRVPPTDPSQMNAFLMGCPEWLPLLAPRLKAEIPEGQTAAIRTPHIPRTDVPQAIPSSQPIQIAQPPYLPAQPGVLR